MHGVRIVAYTRRLFRDDTFAFMVCPAIADLQFEASTGGIATLVRGYVAVAKAVCGGLLHDFRLDVGILSDEAYDLLRIVAMQLCYYAAMVTLIGGAWLRQFSMAELLALVMAAVGVSVITVVVSFWPDRYGPASNSSP